MGKLRPSVRATSACQFVLELWHVRATHKLQYNKRIRSHFLLVILINSPKLPHKTQSQLLLLAKCQVAKQTRVQGWCFYQQKTVHSVQHYSALATSSLMEKHQMKQHNGWKEFQSTQVFPTIHLAPNSSHSWCMRNTDYPCDLCRNLAGTVTARWIITT